VLAPLITAADGADPASTAVIVVDHPAVDATLGTRLATRFPTLAIFSWDPQAVEIRDAPPVVGQLRTFRLAMDMPEGQAQDAWERAAMLIHERYAAQAAPGSAGAKPWAELDEFYRGSNRRLVVNALWMVERIAGHTWDSFGGFPEPPGPSAPGETGPLARLAAIGFDKDAALAMAGAEHEDWARYYRAAGWRYGPKRDNKNKVHNMLLPWDDVRKDAAAETAALTSLADTLYALRELGYRSHPLWQRFRPTGVDTTDGVVRARPARDGEPIETSQGPVAAANTDWIVEDSDGAKSVEPASSFTAKYEPVSM
jgi:RyR domain